jgi:hypothetical protein
MNTNTGTIHEIQFNESLNDFAKRLGGKPSDFVQVARHADGVCQKCKGTGAIKRGLFSRRFKPCSCVL